MSGYTVPIESAISNQTLTYFNLSYNVSGWKKSKEKKNFKSRIEYFICIGRPSFESKTKISDDLCPAPSYHKCRWIFNDYV